MKVIAVSRLNKLKQTQFKTQTGIHSQSAFFVKRDDILNLPVVDAEIIIRCKVCKNRNTEGCPMTYWDGEILIDPTNDKDYCSYAEK